MVLQVPVAVALQGALSTRIAALESDIRAADLSAPLARASVAFAQKEVNELVYLKATLNAAYN